MKRRRQHPVTLWCLLGLFHAGPLAALLSAQDRPAPAVDLSAGWVGFADDTIVSEGLVGGAFRWYVHPHVAIGPEVVYIRGASHGHVVVTGNVTWDLLPESAPSPRRVMPFLVAGGGGFQTHMAFRSGAFTSWEGALTAGGGVRVAIGDRVSLGMDARVGWEPHVRVGAVCGVRLGR